MNLRVSRIVSCCLMIVGSFVILVIVSSRTADAQTTSPITASGLNTQVSTPFSVSGGKVQYDITGGTRPGNGPNLFHSFGEFGVPNNNIANFRNDSALATSNILGRVTGGNPSNIFGMIKTTDFGNANLFLMNPAGILFGPNATLNVGGSVHFTTADYLRLSDSVRFNAIPGSQDALLSTAPMAAFGFLGSNPGAIAVQGSALSVPAGQAISLVGGDISIEQMAHLSAPGGQIRLASVASPGEVLHPTLETVSNINGQTFTNMGTITISGNSTINVSADNVSADAAGTVIIRGGQLVIVDSTISADTVDTNGTPTAIDVNVTGDMSISNDTVPALTARTSGTGDAGEVRISSANLTATSNSPDILTLIDTHTSGTGKAGNVSITTGNLQMTGSLEGFTAFIDSGTEGPGHGGDVNITARNIQVEVSLISSGNFFANFFGEDVTGSAGNVTISTDSLRLTFSQISTDAFSFANGAGQSGNINITAHEMNLDNSQISGQGHERGGTITITTDQLLANDSTIVTQTGLTPGGGVTVTGRVIELSSGSTIVSSTGGDGNAGPIDITATDHLSLSSGVNSPSGIFSNSFGTFGSAGNAGNIVITTPTLEMTGGARINTTTASSGRGGNVTINTTDSISMSGETGSFAPVPLFSLGTIQPSGIFTLTIGGHCLEACGNAGNVLITTQSLTMGSGAQINSGTSSTGQGGNITVSASGTVSISGTLTDGSPAGFLSRTIGTVPGSGHGGEISLNAAQVQLSAGASISAQSTGVGEAGSISINATDSFVLRNSTVTTQATQSDGGNITIRAGEVVQLINSSITTSVGTGAGNGGNITIDPQFVILQSGSRILANAFGGSGGNINIVAGVFLISPDSVIDASSATGISGNINIQSPINDLSGSLAPLPSGFLKTGPLFRSRCSARVAGETTSSFVLASKGGIPTEPGGTLISPLPSTNVQSARFSLSSEDVVLRVAPQFAGSSTALPPLGRTCSS